MGDDSGIWSCSQLSRYEFSSRLKLAAAWAMLVFILPWRSKPLEADPAHSASLTQPASPVSRSSLDATDSLVRNITESAASDRESPRSEKRHVRRASRKISHMVA
jgi:hypothetical protein